jgi:hypothetical protein
VVALLNEGHNFSVDGVEIRRAVLTSEEIADIKAEVSVDHEMLRRTGIRNLAFPGLQALTAHCLKSDDLSALPTNAAMHLQRNYRYLKPISELKSKHWTR